MTTMHVEYTGNLQIQPRRGSFRLSHEEGSLSVASDIEASLTNEAEDGVFDIDMDKTPATSVEQSSSTLKRSSSSIGGRRPMPKLTSEEACDELDRSLHAKPTGSGWIGASLSRTSPRRSLSPSSNSRAAVSAGRALLNRPSAQTSSAQANSSSPFTASAAASPLRRLSTEPAQLKSCLSSSNVLSTKTDPSSSSQANCNEEFKLKRNVSFSHLQVREYAITLGDNPSVSSGPPVTLDWSYDPQEKTAPVDAFEAVRIRRPSSHLVLSDRQRAQLLLAMRPDLCPNEMSEVLQDVAAARLERKMSRNEFLEERKAAALAEGSRIGAGRAAMRARRMAGIRSDQ